MSNNLIKITNVNLTFDTSYNQFYIADKDSLGDTDRDFWSEEAYNSHLAVGEGILGVGMESYTKARCQLKILKVKPTILDFNIYDHVVEAGLQIRTGILQVLNCPDSNVEFEYDIPVGYYGVRVSSKGKLVS